MWTSLPCLSRQAFLSSYMHKTTVIFCEHLFYITCSLYVFFQPFLIRLLHQSSVTSHLPAVQWSTTLLKYKWEVHLWRATFCKSVHRMVLGTESIIFQLLTPKLESQGFSPTVAMSSDWRQWMIMVLVSSVWHLLQWYHPHRTDPLNQSSPSLWTLCQVGFLPFEQLCY